MVQPQREIALSQRLLRRVGAYATGARLPQPAPRDLQRKLADRDPAMQMPRPSCEDTPRKLAG
jgi:hypothetical protein